PHVHPLYSSIPLSAPPLALHSFPTRRSSDLRLCRERHHRAGGPPSQQHRGRPSLRGLHPWHVDGDRERPPAPPPGRRLLPGVGRDRKSTRLNSSHVSISYAVFCLKKKIQ